MLGHETKTDKAPVIDVTGSLLQNVGSVEQPSPGSIICYCLETLVTLNPGFQLSVRPQNGSYAVHSSCHSLNIFQGRHLVQL
jgi:hypothetical protein